MQDQRQAKVIGISQAVLNKIRLFMNSIADHDKPLIPMIGLVHSSTHWKSDGTCVSRGNHFILGAITREQSDDEICIVVDGTEIAVRIPDKERFHGSYDFDLRDGEIVNAQRGGPLESHSNVGGTEASS